MPNYRHLVHEALYAVAEINRLWEILEVIEEGHNNPDRVKTMVQIYAQNLEPVVDNLESIAKRIQREQLEMSRKRRKASQHQNKDNTPN